MPQAKVVIILKKVLLRRFTDAAYWKKSMGIFLLLLWIFLLLAPPLHDVLPPSYRTLPPVSPEIALFDPFPFPEALKPQVAFWKKIFTGYTTQQVIIHDNWYVTVVYEVINLQSLEFATEEDGWKAVNAAQEKYEKLLESLAKQWETPQKMTAAERTVYLLFQDISESPHFKKKAAKDRVRAQVGQADRFKAGLIRAGGYLAAMKSIVAEYGLPEKIVYLPLIESAFNPLAESSAGASGVWQFMRGTGQQYQLAINYLVDERKDPLKATRAAAQLLAHNYEVVQTWPLAITAYNHGLQGIKDAVAQVGSTNIADIVERYEGPRFGFASRNFYAEFLAALDLCLRYQEYFGELDIEKPLTLTQVKLPEYVTVKTLEKYTPLTAGDLEKLNPALRASVFEPGNFLPKDYPLNILLDQKAAFEKDYASIPDALKYEYLAVKAQHRIAKGQTLATIAKQYHTTVKAIVKLNNLSGPRKIRVGQVLKIPGDYVSIAQKHERATPPQPSSVAQKDDGGTTLKVSSAQSETKHQVEKGQTLTTIAKQYHTTVQALAKLNKLSNPRKITVGQVLNIPDSEVSAAQKLVAQKNDVGTDPQTSSAQAETETQKLAAPKSAVGKARQPSSVQVETKHKVEKGQTLTTIAKQYRTTVKAITKFNKIDNPRKLRVGQVLKIPAG